MHHPERAKALFRQNYHCSQAVLASFADDLGITEKQALKLGGCFGSGMCKGEVCGAVTGALMAIGLKYGQCSIDDLESRRMAREKTIGMMERFKLENGSYLCRELLGYDVSVPEELEKIRERQLFTSFCPQMVESAARIAEALIRDP